MFACSSGDIEHDKKVQHVIQKKKEKPKVFVKKQDIITNRNVEERLLEYGSKNKETIVLIKTDKGNIKVRLYEDTPLHRASFILMAKNGCFNNTVFTRVSPQFMAQGGGTYDEEMVEKRNNIGRYTIPAEIKSHHYHKKGALASARSYINNPDKRSSLFDCYLVEGAIYNDLTLDKYEEENNYTYPESHRKYYLNNAGAAHIDGQHTVFGEIIEGLDVISEITKVKRDSRDWTITDIYITEIKVLN